LHSEQPGIFAPSENIVRNESSQLHSSPDIHWPNLMWRRSDSSAWKIQQSPVIPIKMLYISDLNVITEYIGPCEQGWK